MRWLKQSTSVDVPIGPFVDPTDGVTAETGLTLTQADIRLKKNNGNWAQKNASQTLSHEENGFYEVTLDATDTGTLGLLRLAVFESGAAPVWEDFLVVPADVYDALVSGSIGLATAAALATVDTVVDAVKAVTDNLPDGGALTSLGHTAEDVADAVDLKLDAVIPDSVPSDGTRPSIKQALYMITQFLLERSVSGTTLTVRKVDGSTSLFTLTLNDATTPTSITRAT